MELGRDSLKLPVICNINHLTIYCIDLPSCPFLLSPHKCGSVLFGVLPLFRFFPFFEVFFFFVIFVLILLMQLVGPLSVQY